MKIMVPNNDVVARRSYLLAGHVAFAVLMLMALWYAEERVLLVDSAYQLFYDINHESILINDNRYSMVLSQLLPWLLIKLHVPLRWVIVAYSASFVAIAYGCYLLAAYVLRNWKMAVLMLFTFLAMRATFFHCISETFQLMFYAPLFCALLAWQASSRGLRVVRWVALVAVEALAFFIHPVAIFFLSFALGFRLIDGRRLRFDATTVVGIVVLGLLLAVKLLVGQSGHDQSFVPTGATVAYALRHFFTLHSFAYFHGHIIYYLFPLLLWVLTLVGYGRQHLWLKMAFVGGYILAFFLLTVVVYWEGDGPIGMERAYLPLFFMMGLPFLQDELPRLSTAWRTVVYLFFLVMLVVGMVEIKGNTRNHANRLVEVGKIATQARAEGQHKLLLTRSTADEVFPFNIWGLALESMLYTARDGADQTVTLYMEDDDFDRSDDDLYRNPDVYLSVNWWKRWNVSELNPHYFLLPAQGYKELVRTDEGYRIRTL